MKKLIVSVVILASALGWWWTRAYTQTRVPALRYGLQVGDQMTYVVHYDARDHVAMPGVDTGTLDVRTSLDATVRITVVGEGPDYWTLRWQFVDVREAVVDLGASGSSQGRVADLLVGPQALFELGTDGAVGRVAIRDDDPEIFGTLARLLIADTQLVLSNDNEGGASFGGQEYAAAGTVDFRISLADQDDARTVLNKDRDRYRSVHALPWLADLEDTDQQLDYEATVAFTDRVDTVVAQQDLRIEHEGREVFVSRSELSWRAVGLEHGIATDRVSARLAERSSYRLDQLPPSRIAQRSLLTNQVGGLTWEAAVLRLRGFDISQLHREEHDRFLWQLTGLLELQPELCAQLLPHFHDDEVSDDARGLMLDVLAITGHDAAQATLTQLLGSERARLDDAGHARMVQRVARVERPNEATAAFALDAYERAEREHEQKATALTVGSVLRKLPDGSPLKSTLYQRLVDDLDRAETSDEQVRLLRGLANAGQDRNVELALRFADAAEPQVRSAAALALTKVTDPAATGVLGEMVADPHAHVQRTALRVLTEHTIEADVRQTLVDEVLEGEVQPNNYWSAYHVLRDFPAAPSRQQAALFMAQRSNDPRLQGKLLALAQG